MLVTRITTRIAYRLLSGIFIASGLEAMRDPARLVPAADRIAQRTLRAFGVEADTATVVRLNGAAQVGAGALLAAGVLPRVAADVLMGSLIPTTLAGHSFWDERDPTTRARQRTQLLKNLGVLGGLLLVATRASPPRVRLLSST